MLVKTNQYRVLKPCDNCPFLDDGKAIHLDEGRVDKIKEDLLNDGHFVCHKTAYGLDINMNPTNEEQKPMMCAGAYEFLKNAGKPNQIMRVAIAMGVEDDNM